MSKFTDKPLFEQLAQIRAMASTLYDRAKLSGLSEEAIADNTQPIRDLYSQTVDLALLEAQGEVAASIIGFKAQAEYMRRLASIYSEKAEDATKHEETLKAGLLKIMQQRGVDYLEADGFLISRVRFSDGRETIIVR